MGHQSHDSLWGSAKLGVTHSSGAISSACVGGGGGNLKNEMAGAG